MICKECGAQIDDNARECPFCGAVYEENSGAETKEESAPEIADAAEAVSEAPGDTENTPAVPEDDGEDESDILLDENEIKRRRQMERMRAEKQSQLEEIERRREEKRKHVFLKQRASHRRPFCWKHSAFALHFWAFYRVL